MWFWTFPVFSESNGWWWFCRDNPRNLEGYSIKFIVRVHLLLIKHCPSGRRLRSPSGLTPLKACIFWKHLHFCLSFFLDYHQSIPPHCPPPLSVCVCTSASPTLSLFFSIFRKSSKWTQGLAMLDGCTTVDSMHPFFNFTFDTRFCLAAHNSLELTL